MYKCKEFVVGLKGDKKEGKYMWELLKEIE